MRVCAAIFSESVAEQARSKVYEALDILAIAAPAQLARIQSTMHGIAIMHLTGAYGRWDADLQACVIDREHALTNTATHVASTIVHELTHARLEQAGFAYDSAAARHERLCMLAERNLAERLPPSAEADELRRRIQEDLETPPEFWSDAARRERASKNFKAMPWWGKGIRVLGRLIWLVIPRRAS